MTFQNELQKSLVVSLTTLLDSLGVDYFFGGSRRFGYFVYDSDVDIFLSSSCEKNQQKIIDTIEEAGFVLNESFTHDPEYGDRVYRIMDFIHLVFIEDEYLFLANKMNHISIERMIDENPMTITVNVIIYSD